MGLKDASGRTSNDVIITIASSLHSIPVFGDIIVNVGEIDLTSMKFGNGDKAFCEKVEKDILEYTDFCISHGELLGFVC